jgi:hypothetical protein
VPPQPQLLQCFENTDIRLQEVEGAIVREPRGPLLIFTAKFTTNGTTNFTKKLY